MTCEFDRRHYRVDAAAMAAMSWPGDNKHFVRRWREPLDEAPEPCPPTKPRMIRASADPAVLGPTRQLAQIAAIWRGTRSSSALQAKVRP